jgi:two-component system sensor histidine kinase ChiS
MSIRFNREFTSVEFMSEKLQQLDKLKDEFLANTSHELRTPLNGIIGIAESLIDGAAGDISEDVKHNLLMIAASGKRLSSLVNDIMDFSRLKNGEIKIQKKEVMISKLVANVLSISSPLIENKNIKFINDVSPVISKVIGDEDRILQIFHNLIGNACKFTEEGEIRVSANLKNDMLEVCVSDTGIGIEEDKIKSIFESFEQVNSYSSREYGGTGLGLSITKQLILLHGGTIFVKSILKKGTDFYFTLPCTSEVEEKQQIENVFLDDNFSQKSISPKLRNTRKNLTGKIKTNKEEKYNILVVDDELINLQVILNHLNNAGYNVQTSMDANNVFEILQNGKKPDLILLDVMMPKISGYDICKRIRADFPIHILPVILITAKSQIKDIVMGFESGANDYLVKPFHKQELLSRVKNLLGLSQAIQDNNRLLALDKEIEIAKKIQKNILPLQLPEIKGLEISVCYIPMQQIGGDLYDFHIINDEEIGILVADVSGHGISASIVSGMVKMAFKIEINHFNSPEVLLTNMNHNLINHIGKGFVSACYLYINLREKFARLGNAGHPSILYYSNNRVKPLQPGGRVLGAFKDVDIKSIEFNLNKNDGFLLYTDGIIENRNINKDLYGENRLINFAKEHILNSGEDFIDKLLLNLRKFSSINPEKKSFEDDITAIHIKLLQKDLL